MVIDPACRNPSYAVTMLDQKIIEEIRHIASDPKEFDAIIAAGRPGAEQKRRRNAEAEAAIMRRLDDIDANTARLLDLYQRGLAIDKIADRLEPERAHALLNEFLDAVDGDADLDTRRKLLGSLIEKIIVKRTPSDFDIYWTF